MRKNTQITKMRKLARLILFITILLPFVLKSQTFVPDMDKYQTDSLKGFNESEIREKLKFNNVVGSELENHIKQLKRDYINQKFFTVRRKDEKDN
jgi:hypothetical protein